MIIGEMAVQYLLQNGGKSSHDKLVQHLKNQSATIPKDIQSNIEESLQNVLESTVFKKEYNIWMLNDTFLGGDSTPEK